MSLASQVSALAGAVRDKINAMMPRLLPSGGTTGQVLAKTSGTNYDTHWVTGGGGSLTTIKDTVLIDFNVPQVYTSANAAAVGAVVGDVFEAHLTFAEDALSGIYTDQIELEPVIIGITVETNDQVLIHVTSATGLPIMGKYFIAYSLTK